MRASILQHLLKEGSSGVENYGLLLAQDLGMPGPVIERAKEVADKVLEQVRNASLASSRFWFFLGHVGGSFSCSAPDGSL